MVGILEGEGGGGIVDDGVVELRKGEERRKGVRGRSTRRGMQFEGGGGGGDLGQQIRRKGKRDEKENGRRERKWAST